MRLALATVEPIADQTVNKQRMTNPQAKQKHIGTKYGWMA
jgi:hypothetical protein